MTAHKHEHPPSETELKVKALESLLIEKGLIDPLALDELIDVYENRVGPRNGARIVARAWVDDCYRERLLANATEAIAEFGFQGRQGEDMIAVENTPRSAQHGRLHLVLMLSVAGTRPDRRCGTSHRRIAHGPFPSRAAFWRNSASPSAMMWRSASGTVRPKCAIWWCRCVRRTPITTAESQLAELVTRDSMIGTGLPKVAAD